MKESEMSEKLKDLQKTKQQLKEVQSKNKQLQKEKDDLAAKKPHWMVKEEEVEMTKEYLGNGSYGEVYVANFRSTKVAAKCLNIPGGNISEHSKIKFTREMDMCSKLHHPNIVQFIAATDGNTPVLLYELMETSLYDRMQKTQQKLSPEQIVHVTTDILLALSYIHAWKPNPIIHRDVSSSNVLMEQSGVDRWRSKLSDLGSANLQNHANTEHPGNLHYAAPEAGEPEDHTPSMDVYSLGVLIMEMVNNKPPEPKRTDREKQVQAMSWMEMKTIANKCTKKDYNSRPKALELLQEVKTIKF